MKIGDLNKKTIVISRTDSIGDVVLTLPMCAWLKLTYPEIKIIFLGRNYTRPVLECFPFIDTIFTLEEIENKTENEKIITLQSLNIDVFVHVFPRLELARLIKKTKIPYRIGTSHRLYHFFNCNIRPNFSRRRSNLHEAQLNFELLRPLGYTDTISKDVLIDYLATFSPTAFLPKNLSELIETNATKKKIILHPKSKGSAVEWPLEKFIELAEHLAGKGWLVFFSGTEKEGEFFHGKLPRHPSIIDISGSCSLSEFMTFISNCNALVACSTGPLHLASIIGIKTIGIYPDVRPMHPGRWAPLGKNTFVISPKHSDIPTLKDVENIDAEEVISLLGI